MFPLLPTDEVEGVATSDLKSDDIKLYGSKLYKENSFALIMTCTLLFTVLAAAIILCMDEKVYGGVVQYRIAVSKTVGVSAIPTFFENTITKTNFMSDFNENINSSNVN